MKKVHREVDKIEECIKIGKTTKQRELDKIMQFKEEAKILLNEEKAKEREANRNKEKGTL